MNSNFSSHRMDIDTGSSPRKIVECKICKDEDEASTMEVPCSCRGSLKYAHRDCVQKWCNEKGDTICEICHQQFEPGYRARPPLFHCGGIPMNFRGNWEISRIDLHNPQFITMVPAGGNFLDPNSVGYHVPNTRSMTCCRMVAMIFVVLLVLRHTLPFIIYGSDEYSVSLFMILILRTIGILLPIYIMVKTLTCFLNRPNHQDSHILPIPTSDEENEIPRQLPESLHIHIPNIWCFQAVWWCNFIPWPEDPVSNSLLQCHRLGSCYQAVAAYL